MGSVARIGFPEPHKYTKMIAMQGSPFSTPAYMADPYPYYAELRADSPVMF